MAPSTVTPSNLHRAPVACLKCRAAKVRCLVSQRPDRCDRCISNDAQCVFTRPKRAKAGREAYLRRSRPTPLPSDDVNEQRGVSESSLLSLPTPRDLVSVRPAPASNSHNQQPLITPEIRARIVATLASLRGKRGAPFSFVTSGDQPSFSAGSGPEVQASHGYRQQSSEHPESTPASLKMSWLLRPLGAGPQPYSENDRPPMIKMPSYASSIGLSQTITDPVEGGVLLQAASQALFTHFMLEMNSKWEYILDPHLDTHDDVRRRSPLLFATVLFCSSKFTNYTNDALVSTTDPFILSRLCSIARGLAIKAFADGDRSIETMQALYLMVCWKDPEDDVSYLHSGYAFRVLHDLDLEQGDGDGGHTRVRRMRAWLAMFRQDRQQSLFFVRRGLSDVGDYGPSFLEDLDSWLKMPHVLPQDFVAACSADVRRVQSKLRAMVQRAPSSMLPCLQELMDSELRRWRTTWRGHLTGWAQADAGNGSSIDRRLLHPGKSHLDALMGLWEHSIRLNVASFIFRQALMASVGSSLRFSGEEPPPSAGFDITTMGYIVSSDVPGLASSVEGAFGTLQYLLMFPVDDLRRSPDSSLLLAPNAALFLCLLLCLPCDGILGPSFQRTAVGLIRDVAMHIREAVRSPQDTVNLHTAYLDSLTGLLAPTALDRPQSADGGLTHGSFEPQHIRVGTEAPNLDQTDLQAAQVLAGGMGSTYCTRDDDNSIFSLTNEPDQALHMQSLANLLDTNCFWEMPPLNT